MSFVFLSFIIASNIVTAQVTQPSPLPTQPFLPLSAYPSGPAYYDRPQGDFGRGRFGLSFGAEGLTATDTNHETLGFLTLGTEYFAMKGIAIVAEAELCPGTFEAGQDDCLSDSRFTLRAGGGMLFLRGYLLHFSDLSLYVDGGIGGMHAHAFPQERVDDNWVQAIGCGASFRAGSNTYVFAGARYVRLSSNFLAIPGRPQSNGVQYYIGVSVRS
jgi:hypothetical protein